MNMLSVDFVAKIPTNSSSSGTGSQRMETGNNIQSPHPQELWKAAVISPPPLFNLQLFKSCDQAYLDKGIWILPNRIKESR